MICRFIFAMIHMSKAVGGLGCDSRGTVRWKTPSSQIENFWVRLYQSLNAVGAQGTNCEGIALEYNIIHDNKMTDGKLTSGRNFLIRAMSKNA